MQRGADVLQAVPPLALAQGVNLLLGRLQHFCRGAHLFVDHFGDLRGRLVQAPEHCLLPDDVGVAHHIGSGRRDLHKLQDVVPGIVVVIAQLLQLVQHRHRVYRLGEIEHGIDGFVNLPVLGQEKVLGLYDANHISDTAAVYENRAQNRLLRLQRLGWLPLQQFFIHVVFSFLW